MTYEISQTMLASDLNTLLGSQGTNVYTSGQASAAAPAAGLIYGVGYGQRGYGQTQYAQNAVTSGGTILSSQWSNLRNMMAVMSRHQSGSVLSSIPPLGEFAVGAQIEAHESSPPTSDAYDLNSAISTLDTNRQNTTTLTDGSNLVTETRTGTWAVSLQCVITVVFTDGNHIRHFFNAGGQIRANLSQPGVSAQDIAWNSGFVTTVGEIRMGPTSTSTTGAGGLSSTTGYWDLTTSYATILSAPNFLANPYDTNDLLVEAKYSGVDLNGSLGNQVDIRFTLTDSYNGGGDSVASGTAVSVSYRNEQTHLINPLFAPASASATSAWSGS